MRRYVPYAIGMAVAWVMLWDQITPANFLGGLAVAAILLVVFPLPPVDPAQRLIVRPLAVVRLAAAEARGTAPGGEARARPGASCRFGAGTRPAQEGGRYRVACACRPA